MEMKKLLSVVFVTVLIFIGIIPSYASDEDIFSAKIAPDALLVLDLSNSMNLCLQGITCM